MNQDDTQPTPADIVPPPPPARAPTAQESVTENMVDGTEVVEVLPQAPPVEDNANVAFPPEAMVDAPGGNVNGGGTAEGESLNNIDNNPDQPIANTALKGMADGIPISKPLDPLSTPI